MLQRTLVPFYDLYAGLSSGLIRSFRIREGLTMVPTFQSEARKILQQCSVRWIESERGGRGDDAGIIVVVPDGQLHAVL